MVLQKLYTGVQIGLIELVRHVPAEGAELAPLLHDGVEEADAVQQAGPLRRRRVLQQVLRHVGERPPQTGPDALRGLVGELDRHLWEARRGRGQCGMEGR